MEEVGQEIASWHVWRVLVLLIKKYVLNEVTRNFVQEPNQQFAYFIWLIPSC